MAVPVAPTAIGSPSFKSSSFKSDTSPFDAILLLRKAYQNTPRALLKRAKGETPDG